LGINLQKEKYAVSHIKLKSMTIGGYGILTIMFLAGCVPTLVNQSPRSVVVKGLSHPSEGQAIADQNCNKYGRHAIHRPDNIRDGYATYECVK
jgi:hypothetical protein